MPNSLSKVEQPDIFLTRFLATLAVVAASCLVGCVNLTEPWKQPVSPAGTGGSGAGGSFGDEAGQGDAGGETAGAGGAGGSIDAEQAGAGGAIHLDGAGASGSIDLGPEGSGGVVDALADIPSSDTGSVSTGGTLSGLDGASTGGIIGGTGGKATGGTMGGSGGKATGGSGSGGAGGAVDAAAPPPDGGTQVGLVVHYTFESVAGNVLSDTSGKSNNGTLNDAPPAPPDGGTAVPGYSSGTGKVGNRDLVLTSGSNGYVSMPPGILTGATEMTIATWVNITSVEPGRRIIDIGITAADTSTNPTSGATNVYMNLVPATGTSTSERKLTFSITNSGCVGEQRLVGSNTFPTNAWTHVAVVLGGGSGALYINGAVAASGAISLRPADLGAINYAYIGKSQFVCDPYLDGQIDNFRIYNRALSAGDIRAVYNGS